MNSYIFYPDNLNDFERIFNGFIESKPYIEIITIQLSRPFINFTESHKHTVKASIFYN